MKAYLWAPSNNGRDLSDESKKRGIKRLEKMGYDIIIDPNIDEDYLQLGINKPSNIVKFFSSFIKSYEPAILIPFYGGLTSNLHLEMISNEVNNKEGKIVCGKSDLTSLLNSIYSKYELISIYGIDLSHISNPNLCETDLDIIKKALNKEEFEFNCPEVYNDGYWYIGKRDNHKHATWSYLNDIKREKGQISGYVVGGNLESLCTTIGTEFAMDFTDKLVVIESVPNVSPKRFLMNFKHLIMGSNLLAAKALLIGKFGQDSILNQKHILKNLLVNEFNITNIPILCNIDFSHTEPSFPFYIGGHLTIDIKFQKMKVSYK